MAGISGISNWGSLTADQIKEYENEGYDVPNEYLEWAEETKDSTSTYNQASSTTSSSSSTDTTDASSENEAQELYQKMSDEGVSIMDIADTFIQKCDANETFVTQALKDLEGLNQQSENTSSQINDETDISAAALSSLSDELDQEINNSSSGATGESDDNTTTTSNTNTDKIQDLSSQINNTSSNSEYKISGLNTNLSQIGDKIKSCSATATDATEYADQTISIADKLYEKAGKTKSKAASRNTGAIIGGVAGAAVGGTIVASATTSTVASFVLSSGISGSIEVATGIGAVATGGILLAAVGVGVALGAIFGGLFGSSKKKKYAQEADKAQKAGEQLQQNAKDLASKSDSSKQTNALTLTLGQAKSQLSKAIATDAESKADSALSNAANNNTAANNSSATTDSSTTDTDSTNKKKTI